jgi:hypothetical protein
LAWRRTVIVLWLCLVAVAGVLVGWMARVEVERYRRQVVEIDFTRKRIGA